MIYINENRQSNQINSKEVEIKRGLAET